MIFAAPDWQWGNTLRKHGDQGPGSGRVLVHGCGEQPREGARPVAHDAAREFLHGVRFTLRDLPQGRKVRGCRREWRVFRAITGVRGASFQRFHALACCFDALRGTLQSVGRRLFAGVLHHVAAVAARVLAVSGVERRASKLVNRVVNVAEVVVKRLTRVSPAVLLEADVADWAFHVSVYAFCWKCLKNCDVALLPRAGAVGMHTHEPGYRDERMGGRGLLLEHGGSRHDCHDVNEPRPLYEARQLLRVWGWHDRRRRCHRPRWRCR